MNDTKIIILARRYGDKVDQDFMDLEFERFEQERINETIWEREELTRLILTGHGDYYNKM